MGLDSYIFRGDDAIAEWYHSKQIHTWFDKNCAEDGKINKSTLIKLRDILSSILDRYEIRSTGNGGVTQFIPQEGAEEYALSVLPYSEVSNAYLSNVYYVHQDLCKLIPTIGDDEDYLYYSVG